MTASLNNSAASTVEKCAKINAVSLWRQIGNVIKDNNHDGGGDEEDDPLVLPQTDSFLTNPFLPAQSTSVQQEQDEESNRCRSHILFIPIFVVAHLQV